MRINNIQNSIQPLRFALSPGHRSPNHNLILHQNNRNNPTIKYRNISSHYSSSNRSPCFHSANVSRQKIGVEEEVQGKHLQFNKQLKNRLKPLHKRTRSNCVDLLREEEESNFSNSLQNISEEIIEIPFANQVISPRNQNHLHKEKKQDRKTIQGKKDKQKMSSSTQGKISFQRKSIEKVKQTNNKENIIGIKKYKDIDWKIPKPQKSTTKITSASLSHFSLKPIKITDKGSIVYIALHKQTCSIFAIKSIKKKALQSSLDSFTLQMKLGLTIQHPNIAKIYGFFSEGDNFFIVKQFLQEGCIFDRQIFNEGDIGCQINEFMNAILTLIPLKGYELSFNPRQLCQTYGICKISTIHLNKDGNMFSFSDKFKALLLSLIDRDRKSQYTKDYGQTKQSIFFNNLNRTKQGSFFFNKIRDIIQQSVLLSENELLMIWQSDFLRLYRSKSLMRQ